MAGRRWAAALMGLCLAAPTVPGQGIPQAGFGVPRSAEEVSVAREPRTPGPVPEVASKNAPGPKEDAPPGDPPGPVIPAAWQAPGRTGEEAFLNYLIQLEPPGADRLFRLESENAMRERIRQEERALGRKVDFPDRPLPEPTLGTPWRTGAMVFVRAEPGYVCYRRTWFQQRNFERYGWDLGAVTPVVCAGIFFADVAASPLHWLVDPLRRHECSAGLCLPGDPVPMLWYPLGTK